jgi:hypothetical protein
MATSPGAQIAAARTSTGLEIYVPPGSKMMDSVEVFVNGTFVTSIARIGPGNTLIPYAEIEAAAGTRLKSPLDIRQISLCLENGEEYDMMCFSWR